MRRLAAYEEAKILGLDRVFKKLSKPVFRCMRKHLKKGFKIDLFKLGKLTKLKITKEYDRFSLGGVLLDGEYKKIKINRPLKKGVYYVEERFINIGRKGRYFDDAGDVYTTPYGVVFKIEKSKTRLSLTYRIVSIDGYAERGIIYGDKLSPEFKKCLLDIDHDYVVDIYSFYSKWLFAIRDSHKKLYKKAVLDLLSRYGVKYELVSQQARGADTHMGVVTSVYDYEYTDVVFEGLDNVPDEIRNIIQEHKYILKDTEV